MSRLALKQGHFNIILRSTQGCSTRSSSARLAWQDEKLGQSCGNDHPVEKEAATASLQLCVLLLGLLEDGDVGVGVFPEREEIPFLTFRPPYLLRYADLKRTSNPCALSRLPRCWRSCNRSFRRRRTSLSVVFPESLLAAIAFTQQGKSEHHQSGHS
jgi:hypothetical protein